MAQARPNPTSSESGGLTLGALLTVVVAIMSAGAGVIHLSTAGKHLDHELVAAGFVAMALGQFAVGGALVFALSRATRALMGAAIALTGGIVVLWMVTRLTALPFIPGLEERQSVGIEDALATTMAFVVLAAAGLWFALPRDAFRAVVPAAPKVLSTVGVLTVLLLVPGVIAPHDHGAHGHDDGEHLNGELAAAHGQAGADHPHAGETKTAADHHHSTGPAGMDHHSLASAVVNAGTASAHPHGAAAHPHPANADPHSDGGHSDGSHSDGNHSDGHGHGGAAIAYQDADCTPLDDAFGPESMKVLEEKQHHMNGRTECVLANGAGTPIQELLCPGRRGRRRLLHLLQPLPARHAGR